MNSPLKQFNATQLVKNQFPLRGALNAAIWNT